MSNPQATAAKNAVKNALRIGMKFSLDAGQIRQKIYEKVRNVGAYVTGEISLTRDPVALQATLAVQFPDKRIQLNVRKERSAAGVSPKNAGSQLANFIAEVESLGFEKLLELPFEGRPEQGSETFLVYFHRHDCIPLVFYSWGGNTISRGAFYFQWKRSCSMEEFHKVDQKRFLTASGGWEITPRGVDPEVFRGFHWIPDKKLGKTIRLLKEYGTFLCPWTRAEPINLTHYGDYLPGRGLIQTVGGASDHGAYLELQRQRMRLLPADVRAMLCIKEEEFV